MIDLKFTMVHDHRLAIGHFTDSNLILLIAPGDALAVRRPGRPKMPTWRKIADLLRRLGVIGRVQQKLLFAIDLGPGGDFFAVGREGREFGADGAALGDAANQSFLLCAGDEEIPPRFERDACGALELLSAQALESGPSPAKASR